MLGVQLGKDGIPIFCCPAPWLLGKREKICVWTNHSIRAHFHLSRQCFLSLIYFFLLLSYIDGGREWEGNLMCRVCQLKYSSQPYKAQRTTPVCTNSAASLLEKFSDCYPVFPALLLHLCFITVCYFLLATSIVHYTFLHTSRGMFFCQNPPTKQVTAHIIQKLCNYFLNKKLSLTSVYKTIISK